MKCNLAGVSGVSNFRKRASEGRAILFNAAMRLETGSFGFNAALFQTEAKDSLLTLGFVEVRQGCEWRCSAGFISFAHQPAMFRNGVSARAGKGKIKRLI